MPGESSLSTKIINLVGGATVDEEFLDDACMEACKEIIHQLPLKLQTKCGTITIRNATNGTNGCSINNATSTSKYCQDSS